MVNNIFINYKVTSKDNGLSFECNCYSKGGALETAKLLKKNGHKNIEVTEQTVGLNLERNIKYEK